MSKLKLVANDIDIESFTIKNVWAIVENIASVDIDDVEHTLTYKEKVEGGDDAYDDDQFSAARYQVVKAKDDMGLVAALDY